MIIVVIMLLGAIGMIIHGYYAVTTLLYADGPRLCDVETNLDEATISDPLNDTNGRGPARWMQLSDLYWA